MIDHQVLPRGPVLPEIELISQQSAPNRSHAGSPQENFVVPTRAIIPYPRRQSRPRQRCDSLSLTRGFYRLGWLMQTSRTSIHISIRDQLLTLKEDETPIRTYPVSTSRFGIGTEQGSLKTPTGRFRIGEKIGGNMPAETIFRSRVPLKPDDPLPPTADLVMSRILWLDGL